MWLLVLLGLFARLWRFGQVPVSLYWDEVAIGLDAQAILQTGKDLSGHPWLQALFYSYGDYKAPVYIWLTTLLGKLFSVSELTIRLPSLLASLAIAYLLFKLLKLLSPKKSKLPLYTLISFMIMPWAIHFARIGFESHLSVFWLVLSIYLLIKATKAKSSLNIILASFSISLGIYTYISLRVLAPIFFIITFFIFHRSKLKQSLPAFLTSLAIIALSLVILIRSPGYQSSQQYRLSNDNLVTSTSHIDASVTGLQGQESSLLARIYHHRYIYKAKDYLSNYFQYFNPQFLALSGDPNLRHHSGFGGQLLAFQALLLLTGVYALIKQKPRQILLLLTWLALSPAIAALVNETPHASRSIYLIIPLAWLCGLGWQFLAKNKKINLIIVIALTLNLLLFSHDYFSHYPQRSAPAWLNPYKQVALYIKNNSTTKSIYVTSEFYQPSLYFSFYANQEIKSLPSSCPPESLCIASPDWQPDTTQKISDIPNTDKLVIKQAL